MIEGIINGLGHGALAMFIVLVIVGSMMDYPTYKRRKRLEKCKKDQHVFTQWQFVEHTHYGDKCIYRQECRHCGKSKVVISRLHPDFINK